jgi:hypothetical protein
MIVGEFLRRGLYDHAASAAERTRTNSIRLAEALHLLMAEARRAIRKVLWHDELGPRMEDARRGARISPASGGRRGQAFGACD